MNKTKKIRTIESNAKTSARSRTRFSCVMAIFIQAVVKCSKLAPYTHVQKSSKKI